MVLRDISNYDYRRKGKTVHVPDHTRTYHLKQSVPHDIQLNGFYDPTLNPEMKKHLQSKQSVKEMKQFITKEKQIVDNILTEIEKDDFNWINNVSKEELDWIINKSEEYPYIYNFSGRDKYKVDRFKKHSENRWNRLMNQSYREALVEGKKGKTIKAIYMNDSLKVRKRKQEQLKNLQPEDYVEVYSGVSRSTLKHFANHGIDVSLPAPSAEISYHGSDEDPYGVFVPPEESVARSFSRHGVIKTKVRAIHLFTPNVMMKGAYPKTEKGFIQKNLEADLKDRTKWNNYPNSFRPTVSYFMSSSGESQAILLKNIQSEDIDYFNLPPYNPKKSVYDQPLIKVSAEQVIKGVNQ